MVTVPWLRKREEGPLTPARVGWRRTVWDRGISPTPKFRNSSSLTPLAPTRPSLRPTWGGAARPWPPTPVWGREPGSAGGGWACAARQGPGSSRPHSRARIPPGFCGRRAAPPSPPLPPPAAPSCPRRAVGSVFWHFLQPSRAARGAPARPAPAHPARRTVRARRAGRPGEPGGTRREAGEDPGRGPDGPRREARERPAGHRGRCGGGGAPRRRPPSPGTGAARGPRQRRTLGSGSPPVAAGARVARGRPRAGGAWAWGAARAAGRPTGRGLKERGREARRLGASARGAGFGQPAQPGPGVRDERGGCARRGCRVWPPSSGLGSEGPCLCPQSGGLPGREEGGTFVGGGGCQQPLGTLPPTWAPGPAPPRPFSWAVCCQKPAGVRVWSGSWGRGQVPPRARWASQTPPILGLRQAWPRWSIWLDFCSFAILGSY